MDIIATPGARIAQIYQTQTRIAELNKKANIKSVQGQVDKVTLSPKAKQLSQLKNLSEILAEQRAKGSALTSTLEPKVE